MGIKRFGKVQYAIILTVDSESVWCYSNKELENLFTEVCKNKILKKVYVDLQGYLESL